MSKDTIITQLINIIDKEGNKNCSKYKDEYNIKNIKKNRIYYFNK